jgi:hypothetical protein
MPDLTQATLEEIASELRQREGLPFFILFWKEKGEC